jgi:hypothetical protein
VTEPNRHLRDTSLTLVKQATAWLAAGGVAATGLFAGLAVASNTGHTNVSSHVSTNPTTTTTTVVPSTSAGSDDGQQFRAPTTAPTTAAPNAGGVAVVSGGS